MERDFLARMGINPNIMKEPLQYLNEEASSQSTKNENATSSNIHRDINDTDIFNQVENTSENTSEEAPVKVTIEDPTIIQYERFLRSIGIDISKLSISQINQINSVGDPTKLSPEETRNFFRSLGVDFNKVMQVMNKRAEGGKDSSVYDEGVDVCVKVGRNDKCPCGSDKKFKKCCE